MNKSRLLGAVCACFLATQAESAIVTYDADDYAFGAIANDLLPGVTLSAPSTRPIVTGDTIITFKTGTSVEQNDFGFGFTQTNGNYFTAYDTTSVSLRIDFDSDTDYFRVLFHNAGKAFLGRIRAFDSNDILLEEIFTELPPDTPPNQCCLIDPTWAALSRSTNDIAYILLGSTGGTVVSVDIIEFSAVPIPAAVWLFGSGLLGLVGIARHKKAALI